MAYIVKSAWHFWQGTYTVTYILNWNYGIMQQSVNLQNEIITWRAVLQSSKFLSSPNYSSVPKSISGEFLFDDLNDFVDVVSKCKKVWDMIEKGKTTITDMKWSTISSVLLEEKQRCYILKTRIKSSHYVLCWSYRLLLILWIPISKSSHALERVLQNLFLKSFLQKDVPCRIMPAHMPQLKAEQTCSGEISIKL